MNMTAEQELQAQNDKLAELFDEASRAAAELSQNPNRTEQDFLEVKAKWDAAWEFAKAHASTANTFNLQ